MNIKTKLKEAARLGRCIDWRIYAIRARKFEDIDFGCNFQPDGSCAGRFQGQNRQCCCKNCGMDYGYLRKIMPGTEQFYIKRFDPKLGFWRQGKGCILPRAFRSGTCLRHYCYHILTDEITRTKIRYLGRHEIKFMQFSEFKHRTEYQGATAKLSSGESVTLIHVPQANAHKVTVMNTFGDVMELKAEEFYCQPRTPWDIK